MKLIEDQIQENQERDAQLKLQQEIENKEIRDKFDQEKEVEQAIVEALKEEYKKVFQSDIDMRDQEHIQMDHTVAQAKVEDVEDSQKQEDDHIHKPGSDQNVVENEDQPDMEVDLEGIQLEIQENKPEKIEDKPEKSSNQDAQNHSGSDMNVDPIPNEDDQAKDQNESEEEVIDSNTSEKIEDYFAQLIIEIADKIVDEIVSRAEVLQKQRKRFQSITQKSIKSKFNSSQ